MDVQNMSSGFFFESMMSAALKIFTYISFFFLLIIKLFGSEIQFIKSKAEKLLDSILVVTSFPNSEQVPKHPPKKKSDILKLIFSIIVNSWLNTCSILIHDIAVFTDNRQPLKLTHVSSFLGLQPAGLPNGFWAHQPLYNYVNYYYYLINYAN